MDKLTDLLKEASMAYYMGEPFMSDAEFDSLAKMADYKEVGSTSVDNRVSHLSRMYSNWKELSSMLSGRSPVLFCQRPELSDHFYLKPS